MAHEQFTEWTPRSESVKYILHHAVNILEEFANQGYAITLRQLYYQMVSRGMIPNEIREYKRLGDIITKAREAGYVDWTAIVDRGRRPIVPSQWKGPAELLDAAAAQFRIDRWAGQINYVELWCEKDALSSILEPIADRYHIRFMANRGYSSSTAMYDAAQRCLQAWEHRQQQPVIIYLGDHDPSGMDMTRDVEDRLTLFSFETPIEVIRLALNFEQVTTHQPPPNPAKKTDSRAAKYIAKWGYESWELDALNPQTLDQIVSDQIEGLLDTDLYETRIEYESELRNQILEFAQTLPADQE